MKKILLPLLICFGFYACNTKSEPPSASINGIFAAMKSGNMEEVKKYASATDVVMMNFGEQIFMRSDSAAVKRIKAKVMNEFQKQVKDVTYNLKNEKIDGDKATVDVEMTKGEKKDTHKFNLVKEDGMWKVVLGKSGDGMFNSMKGNMGRDRGLKNGLEKLDNMHPDSIKALLRMTEAALDSAILKNNDN